MGSAISWISAELSWPRAQFAHSIRMYFMVNPSVLAKFVSTRQPNQFRMSKQVPIPLQFEILFTTSSARKYVKSGQFILANGRN